MRNNTMSVKEGAASMDATVKILIAHSAVYDALQAHLEMESTFYSLQYQQFFLL